MGRQKSPLREEARIKWLESGGTISTKELAESIGVKETQIRKWKSLEKWAEELEKKKRGGQKNNQNAVGHGAPERNKNAEVHGAYSKVHLESLSSEERAYIESITLNTQENMLRELQLLIAKENDLKRKIKALEAESADVLHVDRVVDMLTPKGGSKRLDNNKAKLSELMVAHDNLVWEINSVETPSKAQEKKLEKLEMDIEILRDKVGLEEDNGQDAGDLTTTMKTVVRVSSFDRAMKLEAELNKTHGRIIKLLDSIKSYELDSRRVELEEKKYRLMKQKITGEFNVNPESGELDDENDCEEGLI